jgi:predicted nuclease of predicted toxin-antitoxin system
MKFLADMGISPKTVAHLRTLGHDAIHLGDQHLGRLTDHAIVKKACSEDRVLLVHDLDFSEIMAAGGSRLPSVVTFRLRKMHPENVNRCLDTVIAEHHEALEQGALITVSEGRIRVRHLPVA